MGASIKFMDSLRSPCDEDHGILRSNLGTPVSEKKPYRNMVVTLCVVASVFALGRCRIGFGATSP